MRGGTLGLPLTLVCTHRHTPPVHIQPHTHSWTRTGTHSVHTRVPKYIYTHIPMQKHRHLHAHTHIPWAHTGMHVHTYTDTLFLPRGFSNKGSAIRLSDPGLLVLWANNYFLQSRTTPIINPTPFKSIIGAETELQPILLFKCTNSGQTILKMYNYK